MQFSTVSNITRCKNTDVVILPFYIDKSRVKAAGNLDGLKTDYDGPCDVGDFKAGVGETLFLYPSNKPEKRILLLGLGEAERLTLEIVRRAYAAAAKACQGKNIRSLSLILLVHALLSTQQILRGITEGLLLANYNYKRTKAEALKNPIFLTFDSIIFIGAVKSALKIVKEKYLLCQAVHTARNLVNGNADDVTPQHFASFAKALAVQFPTIKAKILGKKEIEKEGMGLLLAVNRGSSRDPALVTLSYRGNPNSKDMTALVGKGITFDTGGLNLKPTGSMETMRCDMGGAAAVFGTLQAIAALGLKVNVVGVIPTTENAIDANSFKPGDIYESYSGKTVEIGNTDAEGRLILADAISYTLKNFSPTRLIDIATLTGAVDIALGCEVTGLISNDDALAEALYEAGQDTYERVWRLPLYDEYRDQLKSDIADIKNIGGRSAGAITAGFFIKEFVGTLPWAHLDIASTAYLNDSRRYHPKFGTGIGVRLLVSFLSTLA